MRAGAAIIPAATFGSIGAGLAAIFLSGRNGTSTVGMGTSGLRHSTLLLEDRTWMRFPKGVSWPDLLRTPKRVISDATDPSPGYIGHSDYSLSNVDKVD